MFCTTLDYHYIGDVAYFGANQNKRLPKNHFFMFPYPGVNVVFFSGWAK
jgi:hypothetical protein